MELAMLPFIKVYHLVRFIFNRPFVILNYAHTGFLTIIDKLTHRESTLHKIEQREEDDDDEFINLLPEDLVKDDALDKNVKKISFRYEVKNDANQTIRSVFDATSKEEVEHFLQNEGYTIVSVTPRKSYDIDLFASKKMKAADLSFTLTQLSTYIKAGIPLVDSVRILAKQSVKPEKRKIYESIVYELLMGENFSTALSRQGKVFPRLLINMIKTAEMTGDLAGTLDDMAEYYTSIDQTRKQMISAMTYPSIIFVMAIGVVIFILVFVIPKFIEMFENQNAPLPWITVFVINASNFIKNNYIFIIIAVVLIIFVTYALYQNVKNFKKGVQRILMRMPMIGNIIIYNEVTTFTKTFASLLNHSVFITDSMVILSQLTSNEIYKKIINRSLVNLSKGAKISDAFKGQWAFPVVAYEMLVTGENTGQLGLMMEKVSEHYQDLHKNAVNRLKSLIEPIMIAFLAFIVGGIILSIIIPMFSLYQDFS